MDSLDLALVLFPVGLVAGFVDAIAGGGGLLAIPALLWAGLTPVEALATNKAQAVFGSGTAALQFGLKGYLDLREIGPAALCTFVGAAGGALVVQQIDSRFLGNLIPALLIAFALYFLLSPRVSDLDSHQRISKSTFALAVGTGIGFYDGFFGPGTGTFFAMGCVSLLGYNMRRATAQTKALNFTSNLAALLLFIAGGHIVWLVAAVMAAGQTMGAWLGSKMVLRHGAALVKPLLVTSSVAISCKLLWDQLAPS